MARKHGTPITSYSSIAHCEATFDIRQQIEGIGAINNLVSYGPADLDSEYGGIFFYGVHLIEPIMYMIGEDIEKVKVTRNGGQGSASLVFTSGLFATLVFRNLSYGWNTFIETKDGVKELKPRMEESKPAKYNADMVEMFRSGKEPRSHQSILNGVSVLEALEQSSITEHWEKVNYVTL
jgi:predicted dehydrogenase